MAEWRSALQQTPALAASLGPSESGVTIVEKHYDAFVQVAAWAETVGQTSALLHDAWGLTVPLQTGKAVSESGQSILCVGPGRWLAVGSVSVQQKLQRAVRAEIAVLTDLGHAFTVICVTGPRALELMAKGPAIDFQAAFPPGSVARSMIHHMGVTIFRPSVERFELFVYRGFARALCDWTIDAAAEFG